MNIDTLATGEDSDIHLSPAFNDRRRRPDFSFATHARRRQTPAFLKGHAVFFLSLRYSWPRNQPERKPRS